MLSNQVYLVNILVFTLLRCFSFFKDSFSFDLICLFASFLASIIPGQVVSPTTPSVPQPIRSEQFSKVIRTNRPTVNSLMHLYGPWILDACLLQIKDRYSRTNDCKFRFKDRKY